MACGPIVSRSDLPLVEKTSVPDIHINVKACHGSIIRHTGSTAQRNSRVPTAQLASKGVKLKALVGETIVTSVKGALTPRGCERSQRLTPTLFIDGP
jgi:hypothetical protein